ncbi:hypothetical protein [Protaetiibacter intestinalis]|uniref:Type IV secretion protein Rhs n=1 Tax=Protaetiibacter intestinalis TaxID=2419774 RepID=A0A387B7Y6_9MICO|nr:hypothetical protein [Protaetiibacter intestinalis]AYF97305.1 hypothetical protein D7I47_02915 [Protaetiibacter intestinalis]
MTTRRDEESVDGFSRGNDFAGGGFFNRLNRRLFPWLGPPPLGPYDQPAPVPARDRACPLCGALMSEHAKGTSEDGRTLLYCPATASD